MVTRALMMLLVIALLCCATAFAASMDGGHNNGHGHHGGGHHQNGNNQCRPCNSCRHHDNWCFSNCKRDCGQAQTQGINIEKCKAYGNDAGMKAAQQACDTSLLYCRGSSRSAGPPQGRNKVSLEQCGNAAYGVCQNKGMDPKSSPCGFAFNGKDNCNRGEFQKFYTGEIDWWCNQAVAQFDKKN